MRKATALLLITVLCSRLGVAAEAPAAVTDALKNAFPDVSATSVAPSPLPGFYEAVYDGYILYVSSNGRYLLHGSVVDLATRVDLTKKRKQELRHSAMDGIAENSTIAFGPTDAKYTVTVFTDVDCAYCAKLHREMARYNDLGIRVRYLAFPRAGIPSSSYSKAVSVWCSKDPHKAIGDAKFGKPVEPLSCGNPVREHYDLGRRVMGVTGTPSIVFEDGNMVPGYVPAPELLKILQENEESDS